MSRYSRYEESKLINVSKVYGKGKTQVPSDVRKKFEIKDGDLLKWLDNHGQLVVEKV